MAKGDILLIAFPFTDLSGPKLRPAVVLAENGSDITLCFITSQLQHLSGFGLLLQPSASNGLKKLSAARIDKIATLHISLVKGLLGKFNQIEKDELDKKLKAFLQLP